MTNQIRSYGPGKFSTMVDAYVYDVSMDGGLNEETGDSSCGTWYGLMYDGASIAASEGSTHFQLNPAERELLTKSAGVILSEDSQGFVDVEYFDTMDELDAAWAAIEAEQAEQADDDNQEQD